MKFLMIEKKYADRQIVKILAVLQVLNISYRSSRIFLTNHKEYLRVSGLKEIPSFLTISKCGSNSRSGGVWKV